MRRFTKTEIGVLIATVVVLITANAYWRVKETGRRAKWAAEHDEGSLLARDAGPDAEHE